MKVVRMLYLLLLGLSTVGCVSNAPRPHDFHARSSAQSLVLDPAGDKSGDFFITRSLLCRRAFDMAVTNLAALTRRDACALRAATIYSVDESFKNGLYTIQIDVVWSADREAAAVKVLAVTNDMNTVAYVPSADEERRWATWIGPKQVGDADGTVHFIGISAMAVGRNTVLSARNIRAAELDAQAMAVRAFMGKGRRMTDANAVFRPVFRLRSRHPLCPNLEMFACGYEVVVLDLPSE